MQSKLVIANWKLHPQTRTEAVGLAKKEDLKGVVLMPPLSFLASVGEVLKNAELGAQSFGKLRIPDVFYESPPSALAGGGGGAYTGEVSPEQLKSLGVKYVLVGHSERRAMGETDEMVNKKVLAALKEGLTVILCVGEKERRTIMTDDNDDDTGIDLQEAKAFVRKQLESALDKVALRPASQAKRGEQAQGIRDNEPRLIVAYEPVWAISTRSHGKSDTPKDAAEMIGFIKEFLKAKSYQLKAVLYGGSVNAGDVEGFLEREEIDGVLVGSASLDAEEFGKIVKAAK